MAAPLLAAAAASAAGNIAGSAMSAFSQGRMNKKLMNFQREMFDKTNAYNHPRAQMQRLQAAGLNPNLVYGGSAGGSAGTASQPAAPDLKAIDYTTTGQSLGETAQQYFSWKQIQTGIELNEEKKENVKQDTINKGIDALNKTIQANTGKLNYAQKARLFNTAVKTAEERLRNLSINTDYIRNKDSRETLITNQTAAKIGQEIRNLRSQGKILSEEAIMKRVDRELYEKYRVRPQDPMYYRIIGEILQTLNINPFKN